MAIHNKYFPGTSVSRYLSPDERSWDEAVYQSGKPVLDSELNLSQEVNRTLRQIIQQRVNPSGWLRGPLPNNPFGDFGFPGTPDAFTMATRAALVAGMPITVDYTNTAVAGLNVIQLDPANLPSSPPGVKRTDFVFLEVFRALVSWSPHASATVTVNAPLAVAPGDTVTINGVVLTATAGVPGVDQFQVGANETITAANIAAAINDGGNSFTGICVAWVDVTVPEQVNLQVVDALAGAAGNAVTLAASASFTISGANFVGGADEPNKPTQASIYRNGNVLSPSGVALADDIADPTVGAESTKRVQIQYRIRITGVSEAIDFKTEPDGFSNPNVLAQGTQVAPVATYPFVSADGTTVLASSDATAYGIVDPGLWVAGDGSSGSATALGTVDGFVYAIPLAFVFRRNDGYNGGAGVGFDPDNNANGALPSTHGGFANPIIGAIPAGVSDRPDGYFHDIIVATDVLDLRRQVVPGGLDLKAELDRQMAMLLDGNNRTWAIDTADKQNLGSFSGDVSTQYLVCDEIGRSGAHGGPISTRGELIAEFDHIRRRFGDSPIVERVVIPVAVSYTAIAEPGHYVTQLNPGYTGWYAGDVITIDFAALNATTNGSWIHALASSTGTVSQYWPTGTVVSDVLRVWHRDGHYTTAIDQNAVVDCITGLGTTQIQITLGENNQLGNYGTTFDPDHTMVPVAPAGDVGSISMIFVELEVTYPAGSGTTSDVDLEIVPDAGVYPVGPALELNTTQRPSDFDSILPPVFTTPRREVGVEYVCKNTGFPGPVLDFVVSLNQTEIVFPRRINGDVTPIVTDTGTGLPVTVDGSTEYGSSSQKLILDPMTPLSGTGQTACTIAYYAQDAVPNYGASGYQIGIYYRSNAPQTAGVKAGGLSGMPDPLTVRPVAMSRDLWTGISGVGSTGDAFPYGAHGMSQIPVNANVGAGDFGGEWFLTATGKISVGDFSADTGVLNLHTMIQVDPQGDFTFSDTDTDVEFRSQYKVADVTAYRPTAMAQPLSGLATHKVWLPFLAVATADSPLYRKGEVLLVVITRYAVVDADNTVIFADSGNTACAAVYRTLGMLLLASE
jgi:hypothetical protein